MLQKMITKNVIHTMEIIFVLILWISPSEQQSKKIGFDTLLIEPLWIPSCTFKLKSNYSEVPNRRADWNKRAGLEKSSNLPAFLLSKLINERGEIFCLLHGKLRAGWKENLKNISKHSLLLGTSEYLWNMAGTSAALKPKYF